MDVFIKGISIIVTTFTALIGALASGRLVAHEKHRNRR